MNPYALICVAASLWLASLASPALAADDTPSPTPSPTPTATATLCPSFTPEPLWVEPVISPTDLLTQTITVYIGNGEAVTVTAESGVFTTTGTFSAYGAPARIPMDLLPATTHHLEVQARVRTVYQWGCQYGGYTLGTRWDRYGVPLEIEQVSPGGITPTPTATATPTGTATPRARLYLPLILR